MKKSLLVPVLLFPFMLAGLVQAHDTSNGVTVTTLAKSSSSWDKTALPPYPKETPEITVLRITIPVGTILPWHQHPVINAGVLLQGQLEVTTTDNKHLTLNPGDALIEVVNTWHQGKSTGTVPAEIVVFYAGTPGTPLTIKQE